MGNLSVFIYFFNIQTKLTVMKHESCLKAFYLKASDYIYWLWPYLERNRSALSDKPFSVSYPDFIY